MNGADSRYAFIGTGLFAARCLEILAVWRPPSFVVTSPPAPSGRGKNPARSPVASYAAKNLAVPVAETPDASKDASVIGLFDEYPVEFAFVTDFGQFIREPLLTKKTAIGCLNIHPSLLPLYRGAAPIQRAIMDGAAETGVTVFKLAAGMDSGPVLLRAPLTIRDDDDLGSLRERAAALGVEKFLRRVAAAAVRDWKFEPQDDSLATFAPKISPSEERIDWTQPATRIWRLVRALSPAPGAWTAFRGRRLRVLAAVPAGTNPEGSAPGELRASGKELLAACGDGALKLVAVQTEGKKRTPASEWKNGLRLAEKERFE
jgi:methionyl-tRNA formyltransferase